MYKCKRITDLFAYVFDKSIIVLSEVHRCLIVVIGSLLLL